jgi:ABC-type lipoprotein export system ATPase subunit
MNETYGNEPILRVCGVSRYFPDSDTRALEKVDLDIMAGERIALMGPSGCGKSTLLNLIGALDRPTEGRVLFHGKSIHHEIDVDAYRSRSIGFVFQSFYLLPSLTVIENLQIPAFELPMSNRERVAAARNALEKVGLSHKWNQRPGTLSGGERQRTAIARAIINAPEILLADEPTGNLDSRNAEGILELFDTLCETHRMTLLMVTHDLNVAQHSERIVHMKDGRILPFDGTAAKDQH